MILWSSIWSAKATTSSATFTVTASDLVSVFDVWIAEVSGLQDSPADVGASDEGNSTTAATGNTASTAGADFVVASCGLGGTETSVTPSVWTTADEDLTGMTVATGVQGGAGVTHETWTLDPTNGWVALIQTYKASGAGAAMNRRAAIRMTR